jgi:hypothetical protein
MFIGLTREGVAARLAKLADDIRDDKLRVRPYIHTNGFTKVLAEEFACGARLTLHYWPAKPGAAPDTTRPHDHRYGFTSLLLGGSQYFEEFEEAATGEPGAAPWMRYRYQPFFGGRVAWVNRPRPTGLRWARKVHRQPLDGHYTTSPEVVHQAVTVRTDPCATLVLRAPRERRYSHVYYEPADPRPRGGLQLGQRLPREELDRQMSDVLGMVAKT